VVLFARGSWQAASEDTVGMAGRGPFAELLRQHRVLAGLSQGVQGAVSGLPVVPVAYAVVALTHKYAGAVQRGRPGVFVG